MRFHCPTCGFAISVRAPRYDDAARALLRRHAAGHKRRRRRPEVRHD